jgi:hypothetical protein
MPDDPAKQNTEKIASRIIDEMPLKRFPHDYIREADQYGNVEIPSGDEVIMFRQMEGVSLLIDEQTMFFNDAVEAKYIFYCAKAGITKAPMPERRTIKRIIREFNEDLESWRSGVEGRAIELSPENAPEVVEACIRKSGYYSIMNE